MEPVRLPSGVRTYLKRSPLQRARQTFACRSIGHCGDQVFVDRNVGFLRHPEAIWLGDQVVVKEGARLCPTNPEASIRVGDWTTIGHHTFIFATTSIVIGRDSLIAPFCYLVDANHLTKRSDPIRSQPMEALPIVIGDDVWLGAGVTVLPGVTIETGAVVAAGSVVTKDVPSYAVAAGVPARVVSERSE